jgi:protease-4
MKNFLTTLLGALAALFIFGFAALLIFVGILGAIISAGVQRAEPKSTGIETGSYLVFDLSSNFTDGPARHDFSDLGGERNSTLQLRQVVRALRQAGTDDRIKGILLIGSLRPAGLGSGYGAMQELRAALQRFHSQSKKPIRAYLEFATTKDYYLASVADEVALDPYGVVYLPGLAVEPMFFAGAFEKYGVNVQVTRVGKYKAFVEPFTRRNMSPENREETQRLLGDIWGSLLSDIGRSRGVKVAAIQEVVDREGLIRPEAARRAHLVDSIKYRDQVIDELKAETGRKGSKESFRQVALSAYLKQQAAPPAKLTAPGIALVYAEGDMVDGEGAPDEIGGVKLAREIRRLRQDENVRAIVLRVNSPGGSATAAENIQRELRLAGQAKPVVISMGTYAASGGYWISAYGRRIFAEPTTITGSIGVFGIQFDLEKLAGNFGLSFDRVKTGRFADALTISRPKTPEEIAVLQNMIDWIYGQFIAKVAEGRHLDPAFVQGVAQGRVWSGVEARKLGLVDEIGGLDAAIRYAAAQAKLDPGYRIAEYPQKRDWAEVIGEYLGRLQPESTRARSGVLGQIERSLEQQWAELGAYNDPAGIYARLPSGLSPR